MHSARPEESAEQPEAHERPTPRIWVPRIRYTILGNLGFDRSLSTYTDQPPAGGSYERKPKPAT
jgi:hypothetical protein